MQTQIKVLTAEEKTVVHERSLAVLAKTGLRVETELGRKLLQTAGADVNISDPIVRFPRSLVEESLRLAPHRFTLGARRPGWDLEMNAKQCSLLMDGEATHVIDRHSGLRREGLHQDWLDATRLGDALDEIGLYWHMLEASDRDDRTSTYCGYLKDLFGNFSKHIQDTTSHAHMSPWLLEILGVVFGDRETIRSRHPISWLLCPQSPLIIDRQYTDAYLAVRGWNIPVGAMPMPLLGATAPGSLVSTLILGNCEVLATLCLVQAAEPETPFIYAPALAVMDPRTGILASGAVEQAIMSVAAIEMARFYNLPVEATGYGTHHHLPGIQAGYERALGLMPPVLAQPDILVGPGLLGGSMVLSFEQMVIDAEIFKICRQAHRGVDVEKTKLLDDVIDQVGPGGDFLSEDSTVAGMRGGEYYLSDFGVHSSFEEWRDQGQPRLMEEAKARVAKVLAEHEPMPLDADVEKELLKIQRRAQNVTN